MNSINLIPDELRQICEHLWQKATQKFDAPAKRATGGFVFQRFISSPVAVPEKFELLDCMQATLCYSYFDLASKTIKPQLRRGLILVTRLLQSLVYKEPFKDSFMCILHNFVALHSKMVTHIYKLIVVNAHDL